MDSAKFSYFNGKERVFGNPLRLQRDLYAALGDPDAAFADSEKGDCRAQNIIVDNVREVFGMAPFDPATGEGADDDCCEDALSALWAFLDAKKKRHAGLPISSLPTESIPEASTKTH